MASLSQYVAHRAKFGGPRLLPALAWRRIGARGYQYAFALFTTMAALGLSYLLDDVTNLETTLVLLVAVILVAWFADLAPAILAVVVSSVGAAFIVYDPTFSFSLDTTTDTLRLLLYAAIAPVASLSVGALRRADAAKEQALRRESELNDALSAANESKDAFVGLVSHELRTPITIIAGNAEVLVRNPEMQPATRAEVLREIESEARRLGGVVEHLLVLARVDRGHTLPLEPLLPAREIEGIVREYTERPGGRPVAFTATGPARPALASSVYLRQIVQNLISNAEKYTPDGSPIEVAVTSERHEVRVAVRDSGPGLSEVDLQRVFEPFYRAPGASTKAGAGVGLAVCKRLVEAQSGSITVANRREGGAEFSFTLPVATYLTQDPSL